MSNVDFEENSGMLAQTGQRFVYQQNTTPPLVKMIMKTGIAKDEKTANYILVGIAVVAICLMFYFFAQAFGWGKSSISGLTPAQV